MLFFFSIYNPKTCSIKDCICQKFCNTATVCSHFWDCTIALCYDFLLIYFSLSFSCLSPSKSILSPLSSLPSPSGVSLSLVLFVPLSFWCLSLKQALHNSLKHAAAIILQTHMLYPHHHHRCYFHPYCWIQLPSDLWAISISTCRRQSLHYLHTHMPPPISCSPSTPSYSFFHFLSTSLFPFLSTSWVRGS